jgi:hypothetical protein
MDRAVGSGLDLLEPSFRRHVEALRPLREASRQVQAISHSRRKAVHRTQTKTPRLNSPDLATETTVTFFVSSLVIARAASVACLALVATAALGFGGCKPERKSDSETKWDPTVRRMIDIETLDKRATREICSKRPIFVFVGNAERAGVMIGDGIEAPVINLKSIVDDAESGLKTALSHLPITCTTAFTDALVQKKYMALLVSVVDGDGTLDSTIRTTWFRFDMERARSATSVSGTGKNAYTPGWVASDTKEWKLDDAGKVVANDKGERFEIHLPTQLEGVVRHFIGAKPPNDPDFKFDQTVYLIKSHGGRFERDTRAPTVEALFDAVTKPLRADSLDHAFLFDSHGPNAARPLAELFGASMTNENACGRFAALDPARFRATPWLCRTCGSAVKDKGPFKACGSPGATASASGAGTGTLSMEDGSTMSMEDGSTMSMEDGSTMGTGKGVFFGGKPDRALFDRAFQVAAGVRYSGKTDVPGLTRMTLPLAGEANNAPFVVLDSCWGSPNIGREAFAFLSGTGTSVPIVTAINPNPMYASALNYRLLDYFQYLALPYVFANAEVDASLRPTRDALAQHMKDHGLDQSLALQSDKRFHEVEIHVIRNGSRE